LTKNFGRYDTGSQKDRGTLMQTGIIPAAAERLLGVVPKINFEIEKIVAESKGKERFCT